LIFSIFLFYQAEWTLSAHFENLNRCVFVGDSRFFGVLGA
jgi:hypothetical protein